MNFWAFAFLLSNFIWALFWERSLLTIYIVFMLAYLIPAFLIGFKTKNNFRRRTQIASWTDSGDPCSYTRIEVEMEAVERFLDKYNEKNPENKITLTLLFVKAMALGLARSRETFGKIAFGTFVERPHVDLSFLVDVNGENLANAVLHHADTDSLENLTKQLRAQVKEYKGGKNKDLNLQMTVMGYTPSFVVQALLRIASFFAYDLERRFPPGNVKPHNFGHGIITNIVNFEIPDSYAPLVPFLKCNFVGVMNTPFNRAVVRDGKPAIRKVMNFNLTYDSRFSDAYDLGVIAARVQEVFRNPELLL